MSPLANPEVIEVDRLSWLSKSVAPNGSAESVERWTTITLREEWHAGQYAGRVYKLTRTYVSTNDDIGTMISNTSTPWPDAAPDGAL